jgi:ATPase subunit of ABC transporter with duplicated ATPase domains
MEKQVERLKESQTEVTAGSQWTLTLRGDALRADRLLEMDNLDVPPAPGLPALFRVDSARLKSGDRVAIIGRNGCGKSSLMKLIWQQCREQSTDTLKLHPRVRRVITTRRYISCRTMPLCWTRWSPLRLTRRIAKWR